jgi:hypothetical protein
MGVHEGQGQLSRATKDLVRHWAELKGVWQDANAKRFEETVLTPIEAEVRNAGSAMAQMATLLSRAKSDCQ